MTKLTATAALALSLTAMNPGSSAAGERSLVATPNADGSLTIRDSRRLADWGWSGALPDGRSYRVIAEPHAGSRTAYVRFGDGSSGWVPAESVCKDADWLMRMSDACP